MERPWAVIQAADPTADPDGMGLTGVQLMQLPRAPSSEGLCHLGILNNY